tara:strand:- start:1304 stop:1540 length:237 start_codon:yes stop_codon:yes gene_type:complete
MVKIIIKLITLILVFGFISISPKTRYLIGISYKQISSFLILSVKDENKEVWIIEDPLSIPIQKIKTFLINENVIKRKD